MATHLDLEEQEQLDQLKAFWKQYGNLITWVLIARRSAPTRPGTAGTGASASRAPRPARCTTSSTAPRRPATPSAPARIFADMKERYPRTAFTAAGRPARGQASPAEKGQADAARASLAWVADSAGEDEYRTVARLRLAGLLLDEKKYDEALKQLDGVDGAEFAALAADRRGDISLAAGQARRGEGGLPEGAGRRWTPKVDYRRLVEAKLDVARRRAGARRAASARRERQVRRAARRGVVAAGWPPALLALARAAGGCSAATAQAEAARADRRADHRRAPVWNASIGASQFPLTRRPSTAACVTVAVERRQRRRARGRERPRRSGAPTSAASCRPASAATASVRRWSRATASWSRSTAARSSGEARSARASRPRRWWPASASSCSASIARCRPSTPPTARKLWQLQRARRAADAVAGRRASPPSRTPCVVGQGPRMAGIDPIARRVRWEVALGSPRGANEVERLADLVGPALRTGDLRLRALVPGGGRLRRRRARHAARGPRRSAAPTRSAATASSCSAPTRQRPPARAWQTPTGDVAWTLGSAAVPRPRRAAAVGAVGGLRRRRGHVHWLVARQGRSAGCARRPTAAPIVGAAGQRRRHARRRHARRAALFAFRPA